MWCWRALVYVIVAVALPACATVADDLGRAESNYADARYEAALVWLQALESDIPGMPVEARARYYYLRGMTTYRLGHHADARHHLAVARELVRETPSALRPRWTDTMHHALKQLNVGTPTPASALEP